MQAWQRSTDITTRAGPEHLSGRSCAWPRDRVEVLRARLLGPEQVLSAEHEGCLRGGEVREWVEGVCLCVCAKLERGSEETKRREVTHVLPGLEGLAPTVACGIVAYPSTSTAVLYARTAPRQDALQLERNAEMN